MATASVYIASDQIYDYNCSKCDEHDLYIKAQHFCSECEHYLCEKCVALHNGYHIKHTVYGRGDIQKWAQFFMDKCAKHGKELEVHCDVHQELCCSVCVTLNHRQCSSISHLPDLARGFTDTAEFKKLPAAVEKMRSRLDELRNDRMKYQASLQDSYKNTLAEIKALRKKINHILDKLEKKTVEQLGSMMKDLDRSVKDGIESCAHMHDQLKNMMEQVQQVSGKHRVTNSYIGYKRCQDQLTKVERVIQEIEARPKERVLFHPNTKIETFLKSLDNLGNSVSTYVYNCISANWSSNIEGICEMPNGDFVIAEGSTKRVKLLNSQYEVICICILPGNTDDLCHTVGNEVCVAVLAQGYFSYKSELHFLEVTRGRLQKVRKFTMDQQCRSIAHHQGKLYVGSRNALYQYTMDAELVKKMYVDISCDRTIWKCAVSPDGERIYVTNKDAHKLLTLDKSGQVLSTFIDPELKYPRGVCVCHSGHVFVCGKESHTVLQVDREGTQKQATLARGSDNLFRPRSLCFSKQTSSLIVGAFRKINVLKLC